MEISFLRIDRDTSTATLIFTDGRSVSVDAPDTAREASSGIATMTWAPTVARLLFETTKGDEIIAELPQNHEFSPKEARPVGYLDQNHWSTLAYAIFAPERVRSKGELEAARRIVDLARKQEIILPMSAGHMSETCQWTKGDAGYHLALTMLQLSAGWQMRDPIDVRRFELHQAFLSRFKSQRINQPSVFTLEPNAIRSGTRREGYTSPPDFPAETALMLEALTSTAATFDVMLDANAIEMDKSPAWASRCQRFTNLLKTQPDRQRRRAAAKAMVLADLRKEVTEGAALAGITPGQLEEWLTTFSDADIAASPALGLFREALCEKFLNPRTHWKDSDLHDVMYLTCAGGYADHVVGEKSLTAQMRQGLRRLGRTTHLHHKLSDLADAL